LIFLKGKCAVNNLQTSLFDMVTSDEEMLNETVRNTCHAPPVVHAVLQPDATCFKKQEVL
jgi:hypothetical protein